jgi:hypothetical protein
MWQAITAARGRPRPEPVASPRLPRRPWWRLAAAAVLLVGAGATLGYWARGGNGAANVASRNPDSSAAGAEPAPGRAAGTFNLAVAAHFTAVEAMLTTFRSTDDPTLTDGVRRWARDLLASTRLLLDSPAARDPQRRKLFEDLELILVQIVLLAPDAPEAERAVVDRAIASEQVLTRLRTSITAGMPSGT